MLSKDFAQFINNRRNVITFHVGVMEKRPSYKLVLQNIFLGKATVGKEIVGKENLEKETNKDEETKLKRSDSFNASFKNKDIFGTVPDDEIKYGKMITEVDSDLEEDPEKRESVVFKKYQKKFTSTR